MATKHGYGFHSLALIVLVEQTTATILLPFVVFMVRDFGFDEKDIGYYAGLITSSFFVAQGLATPLWCILANRIGRKPVMLFGLLGSALGIALFGFGRSLTWVILSRTLCGLLNGNMAVARAMTAELAAQKGIPPPKAFSIFGFCLALSWLVGPTIGGALANPYQSYGWAGPGEVWKHFPYLLPCLISAIGHVGVFVQGVFLLEESRPPALKTASSSPIPNSRAPTEQTPLLPDTSTPPVVPPTLASSESSRPKSSWMSAAQASCIFSATFFFLHAIMFDELFPLFASSRHGLDFSSQKIASALISAAPAMLIALLFYPALAARSSTLTLWFATALAIAAVYLAVPLLTLATGINGAPRWVVLETLLMARYGLLVIGLTSINIMLNMVATDESRAMLNGIAQTASSFSRAVGPWLTGVAWSASMKSSIRAPTDHCLVFILIAAMALLQAATSVFMAHRGK